MKQLFLVTLTLGFFSVLISCTKNGDNEPVIPVYTVPDTYNFESAEYSEATGSVSMWAGFTSYLGKATTRQLSQDTVNNLWNNVNNSFTAETASNLPFSADQLNAFGFNIAEKTTDAALIKQYADSQVYVSQFYNVDASPGTPGKVGSRLVNSNGLEFNQVVAKGMMGALQLHQIYNHLDKTTSDDNMTATANGTAMQHDWDLAFGYLGIPANYDTSATYASTDPNRPMGLGGYLKERAQYIQAGGIVFDAFRTGRAAINAADYARRDEAIATIKTILEKTLAAAAYAYFTIPQGSGDLATKFHAMSEAHGFVLALKYRQPNSPLTDTNYQALMDIVQSDFYELAGDAVNTRLVQAQTILEDAYGQLQP